MRKGFFLSTICILTLLIGVGFYIFEKYGDKIIYHSKEKIFELVIDKFNNRIDELEQNVYQDSLKFIIQDYFHKINKDNFEGAINQASNYIKYINKFVDDNSIDSLEFRIIKEKTVNNER